MSAKALPEFPMFPDEDCRHYCTGIEAVIRRVMESGRFILGAEVDAFEKEFAAYLGVRHVIGLGSGTDAIELMLRALEIGSGSKVVVPSHAPSAVAAGVTRCGAGLLLADIKAETFTLCPVSLDAVLRSPAGRGVKAALVVHLYGHPADWAGLQSVADEHGIVLLEDCAQAHGATWNERMVGSLGKAAAFSFYPTKNLGALGDAGALATDDADLAERVRLIRQYGWRKRYISECIGVNSRLDELQAAVLRVKLTTLAEKVNRRRLLAAHYDSRLKTNGLVAPPTVRSGFEHAFHQYVVRSRQRDALMKHLCDAGIPAAVHYPMALHQQPAYRDAAPLPVTEIAVAEILSLPLHPYLKVEALDAVCDAIEKFGHGGA